MGKTDMYANKLLPDSDVDFMRNVYLPSRSLAKNLTKEHVRYSQFLSAIEKYNNSSTVCLTPHTSNYKIMEEPLKNLKDNLQSKLSEIQMNGLYENLSKIELAALAKLKKTAGKGEMFARFSESTRYPLRDFSLPKGSYIRQEVNKLKLSDKSNKENEKLDFLKRENFLQDKADHREIKNKNFSDEKLLGLNFSFPNGKMENAANIKGLSLANKTFHTKTCHSAQVTTSMSELSDNTEERVNNSKINKNNLIATNEEDFINASDERQHRLDSTDELDKMKNNYDGTKVDQSLSPNMVSNKKKSKLQADLKIKKHSFFNLRRLNLRKQNPWFPKAKNDTETNRGNSNNLVNFAFNNESRLFELDHQNEKSDPKTLDMLKIRLMNTTKDKSENEYPTLSLDQRRVASGKNFRQHLNTNLQVYSQTNPNPYQNLQSHPYPQKASTQDPQTYGYAPPHGLFDRCGIKTLQQRLQSQSQLQPLTQNPPKLQSQVPCSNLKPQHFEIRSTNTGGSFKNFRIVNDAFPIIITVQNASFDNDFVPHQDDNSKYRDENENTFNVPLSVTVNGVPTAKLLQKVVFYNNSNMDDFSSPELMKKTVEHWNSMIDKLETVSDTFSANFPQPYSIICNSVNCSIIPCLQALQIMPQVYTSLFKPADTQGKNTTVNQADFQDNLRTNASSMNGKNRNISVTVSGANSIESKPTTILVTSVEPFRYFHTVEASRVQAKHSNHSHVVRNLTKNPESEHIGIKTVHKSSRPMLALKNLPVTKEFALGSPRNIYYPTQRSQKGCSFEFHNPETSTNKNPICPSMYREIYMVPSSTITDKPTEKLKIPDFAVTLQNPMTDRGRSLEQIIFAINYTNQPNALNANKMFGVEMYKNPFGFIKPNIMGQTMRTKLAPAYNETFPYSMTNDQILTLDTGQQKLMSPKQSFSPVYWMKYDKPRSDDYYYNDQLDDGSLQTAGMSTDLPLSPKAPFSFTHSNFEALNRQPTILRGTELKSSEEHLYRYTTTDTTKCELRCPQKDSYQLPAYALLNPRIDSMKQTTKNVIEWEQNTENTFGKSTLRDWLGQRTKIKDVNWSQNTENGWLSCVPCDAKKPTPSNENLFSDKLPTPDSFPTSNSRCICVTENSQPFPQSDYTFQDRSDPVPSQSAHFQNNPSPTRKQRIHVGDDVSELILWMPQNLPKMTLIFEQMHQKPVKALINCPIMTKKPKHGAENSKKSSVNTDSQYLKFYEERKTLDSSTSRGKKLENRALIGYKDYGSMQNIERDHTSGAASFMRLKSEDLSSFMGHDFIWSGDSDDDLPASPDSGKLHSKYSESLQTDRLTKGNMIYHHSRPRAKIHNYHANFHNNQKYMKGNDSRCQNKTHNFHLQQTEQKFTLSNFTNITGSHHLMSYLSTMIRDHPLQAASRKNQHNRCEKTFRNHRRKDEYRQSLRNKEKKKFTDKQFNSTLRSKQQQNLAKQRGLTKYLKHFKTRLGSEKKAQHMKPEHEHLTTTNETSSAKIDEFSKESLETWNATSSTAKTFTNTTFLFDEDEVMHETSDSIRKNDAKSSKLSTFKKKSLGDLPRTDRVKNGKVRNTVIEKAYKNHNYDFKAISGTRVPNITTFFSSNLRKLDGIHNTSHIENSELKQTTEESAQTEGQFSDASCKVELTSSTTTEPKNTHTTLLKLENQWLDKGGTLTSGKESSCSNDTVQTTDQSSKNQSLEMSQLDETAAKLFLNNKNNRFQNDSFQKKIQNIKPSDNVTKVNESRSVLDAENIKIDVPGTTLAQNEKTSSLYLYETSSIEESTRSIDLLSAETALDRVKNLRTSAVKSKPSKLNEMLQQNLMQPAKQNSGDNESKEKTRIRPGMIFQPETSDMHHLNSSVTYFLPTEREYVGNIVRNESNNESQQKNHHGQAPRKKSNTAQKKIQLSPQIYTFKNLKLVPDAKPDKNKKRKSKTRLFRRRKVYAHVHGALPLTVDDTKVYHAIKVPSSLITPYLASLPNVLPQSIEQQNISTANETLNSLNQREVSNSCNLVKNRADCSDLKMKENNKNQNKTEHFVPILGLTQGNLRGAPNHKLGSEDNIKTATPDQVEKIRSEKTTDFREITKLREKLMGNKKKENCGFFTERKPEGNVQQPLPNLEKYTGSILQPILLPKLTYFNALTLTRDNSTSEERLMIQTDSTTQIFPKELNDQLKEEVGWFMHNIYNTPYDTATNADTINLKSKIQNEGAGSTTPRIEDQFEYLKKFGQLNIPSMAPQGLNIKMDDQNIYSTTQGLGESDTSPVSAEYPAKASFTLPIFLMPNRNKWRMENVTFNSWQHKFEKANEPFLDTSVTNHQLADTLRRNQKEKDNLREPTKSLAEYKEDPLLSCSNRNTTSPNLNVQAILNMKQRLFNFKTDSPHLHFCSPQCKNNNCSMVVDFDSYVPICKKRISGKVQTLQMVKTGGTPKFKLYYITIKPDLIPRLSQYIQSHKTTTLPNFRCTETKLPNHGEVQTTSDESSTINSKKELMTSTENKQSISGAQTTSIIVQRTDASAPQLHNASLLPADDKNNKSDEFKVAMEYSTTESTIPTKWSHSNISEFSTDLQFISTVHKKLQSQLQLVTEDSAAGPTLTTEKTQQILSEDILTRSSHFEACTENKFKAEVTTNETAMTKNLSVIPSYFKNVVDGGLHSVANLTFILGKLKQATDNATCLDETEAQNKTAEEISWTTSGEEGLQNENASSASSLNISENFLQATPSVSADIPLGAQETGFNTQPTSTNKKENQYQESGSEIESNLDKINDQKDETLQTESSVTYTVINKLDTNNNTRGITVNLNLMPSDNIVENKPSINKLLKINRTTVTDRKSNEKTHQKTLKNLTSEVKFEDSTVNVLTSLIINEKTSPMASNNECLDKVATVNDENSTSTGTRQFSTAEILSLRTKVTEFINEIGVVHEMTSTNMSEMKDPRVERLLNLGHKITSKDSIGKIMRFDITTDANAPTITITTEELEQMNSPATKAIGCDGKSLFTTDKEPHTTQITLNNNSAALSEYHAREQVNNVDKKNCKTSNFHSNVIQHITITPFQDNYSGLANDSNIIKNRSDANSGDNLFHTEKKNNTSTNKFPSNNDDSKKKAAVFTGRSKKLTTANEKKFDYTEEDESPSAKVLNEKYDTFKEVHQNNSSNFNDINTTYFADKKVLKNKEHILPHEQSDNIEKFGHHSQNASHKKYSKNSISDKAPEKDEMNALRRAETKSRLSLGKSVSEHSKAVKLSTEKIKEVKDDQKLFPSIIKTSTLLTAESSKVDTNIENLKNCTHEADHHSEKEALSRENTASTSAIVLPNKKSENQSTDQVIQDEKIDKYRDNDTTLTLFLPSTIKDANDLRELIKQQRYLNKPGTCKISKTTDNPSQMKSAAGKPTFVQETPSNDLLDKARHFWKSKLSTTSQKTACATIKCSSLKIWTNLAEAPQNQNKVSIFSQYTTESMKEGCEGKRNKTNTIIESFNTSHGSKSLGTINGATEFFSIMKNTVRCETKANTLNITKKTSGHERIFSERKNSTQTTVTYTNTKDSTTEKMRMCLKGKNGSNYLTTHSAIVSDAQAILHNKISKGSTTSVDGNCSSVMTPITESTPRCFLMAKPEITTDGTKTDSHQKSTLTLINSFHTATDCNCRALTAKNSKAQELQTDSNIKATEKLTSNKSTDSSNSILDSFQPIRNTSNPVNGDSN